MNFCGTHKFVTQTVKKLQLTLPSSEPPRNLLDVRRSRAHQVPQRRNSTEWVRSGSLPAFRLDTSMLLRALCWSASSSCHCNSNHSASAGCFPLGSCVVALPSLVQSSLEKTAVGALVKRRHKLLHINDPRCHWECEQGHLHELTDPPQVDLRMCRLAMVSICAKINGSFHSLQLGNDEFLRLVLHQRLETGDECLWRIGDNCL